MKKTIIAAVTGIIFGFIGCIAAIVKIFSKLCEVTGIRDEIVRSLKSLITIAMYGNNGSYRPYMYYYNNYADDVIRTIRSVKFKSQSDADMVLNSIRDRLEDFGQISVAEVYSLISEHSDKELFSSRYSDTRYGWNYDYTYKFWQTYDRMITALRPVKLTFTEASA